MIKYVDLEKGVAGLTIRLRPEFSAKDIEGMSIEEILEWHLCNGWTIVPPEECGALTSGLIITDDWDCDDNGNYTRLGRVYWDSNYQVVNAADVLRENRSVRFLGS